MADLSEFTERWMGRIGATSVLAAVLLLMGSCIANIAGADEAARECCRRAGGSPWPTETGVFKKCIFTGDRKGRDAAYRWERRCTEGGGHG